MRKQSPAAFRCQLFPDNDAGRALTVKALVRVLICFAESKGHHLGRDIGTQLGLAGTALNFHILFILAFLKADELERYDVRPLMQELIEGVLSVRTRLAKQNRACLVVYGFAKAVHRFAVGFHIHLLQMGREAAQRLRIRKQGSRRISEYIALIDSDQCIQHLRVLQRIRLSCQLVLRRHAVKESGKDFRTEGQGQNRPADCRRA